MTVFWTNVLLILDAIGLLYLTYKNSWAMSVMYYWLPSQLAMAKRLKPVYISTLVSAIVALLGIAVNIAAIDVLRLSSDWTFGVMIVGILLALEVVYVYVRFGNVGRGA